MEKMPVAILIGRGSRLPKILEYSKNPDCGFEIKIIASYKKLEENGDDVLGIKLAKEMGIPAIYFNLPNWKSKLGKSREEFNEYLGWFLSQPNYNVGLVFMTGWGLVMDSNFLKFFPRKDRYFNVINVHPSLLPDNPKDIEITLKNGQIVPVIRGEYKENAIQMLLDQKAGYGGSTIHFVTEEADAGPVIMRGEVKVEPNDTVETLYPRIQTAEDTMGYKVIDLFAKNKLKIVENMVEILP